jgi:hypothetical protein
MISTRLVSQVLNGIREWFARRDGFATMRSYAVTTVEIRNTEHERRKGKEEKKHHKRFHTRGNLPQVIVSFQDQTVMTASLHSPTSHIDVDQHWFSNTFDLGNDTFEIKRFGKHDFEDLLHVDRRGSRAENERGMHGTRKSFCLVRERRVRQGKRMTVILTCFVISSCSSRGKVANVSNLVPIRNGMAV